VLHSHRQIHSFPKPRPDQPTNNMPKRTGKTIPRRVKRVKKDKKAVTRDELNAAYITWLEAHMRDRMIPVVGTMKMLVNAAEDSCGIWSDNYDEKHLTMASHNHIASITQHWFTESLAMFDQACHMRGDENNITSKEAKARFNELKNKYAQQQLPPFPDDSQGSLSRKLAK